MDVRYEFTMSAILQRITAWLCLAAAFLTGLAPAQGFVLCLQPNGRMSVDLATPAEHCKCCAVHAQGTTPLAQPARALDDACCECVDVPVSGALQDRLCQPRPIVPQLGPWIAPSRAAILQALVLIAPAARAPRAEVPRPPDSLALIRSVVLLI
jgi:hypothetical protein